MKIAEISPYDFAHPGGVQRHISSLSSELVSRGHDVTVIGPCSKSTPLVNLENVNFVPLGRSIPFPTAGSVARISISLWHEWKLKSFLQTENFDIVHIHEPLMPLTSLTAATFSRSTTIGTFHAYNEGRSKGYILGKRLRLLERFANKLDGRIAVSEPAKIFHNKYFPSDYKVIPNGLDVERFSTPTMRPTVMKSENINLLFVGRVNESRKGLRYALGAYSRLKWQYPKLRLIVVGSGVPDKESYRVMGERSLDDVIFLGPMSESELPSYYQHADIFLAPNTGKESFGFITIESMASSTPVIAASIPGFQSVIKDGYNGILVEPKNEKSIAIAIKKLIDNPSLRTSLEINGRLSVEKYSWKKVTNNIIRYFNNVKNIRNDTLKKSKNKVS
tara:strand:- start:4651 stop:5820 length:1170 start_codon:yes stop_codon:yes gene_type:complete